MKNSDDSHYPKVAEAITFIKTHFKQQPNLNEIAKNSAYSPANLQCIFSDWAGTSPKKFLQYTSVEYAKRLLLENNQATLFDEKYSNAISLRDFVHIDEMTHSEYKNLQIEYSFTSSPFGNVIIGSTAKGICYLAFEEDNEKALSELKNKFPNASFQEQSNVIQQNALQIFQCDWTNLPKIKLHIKGTDFQLKVWESLLGIPFGKLSTYGKIAQELNNPNASRAVGTAIGNNPIAFLIPCHRVVQSTGRFEGYRWGTTRKTAMIGWEQVQIHQDI
ncbi:MAG TPA: bifunctional helix-turn-helix domain-containing protein/methylated-DNA--[protein]-cysteine S-methyltransferase [Flavobacterium sp.]|nr:bifunctional helix-turn-helix domain-containing protein/methylated-DNA--[protein]-cysteine S-methyltransferase [Flavobacterium sp.]